MNNFKLLAIRPLGNPSKRFLKMLEPEHFYSFYKGVNFIPSEKNQPDKLQITIENQLPDNFHANKKAPGINVSAIVGKNGSGKSSLIEMLFAAIHNFALEKKIVRNNRNLRYAGDLSVEIYYQIDEIIYCVKINSGVADNNGLSDVSSTKIYCYEPKEKNKFYYSYKIERDSKLIYDHFFYTIAINYSIYGLNCDELGQWIEPLFHKNDGYQTPVVINPFRDHGNINIKIENELVRQRLLANLLEPIPDPKKPEKTLRNLAKGKNATWLSLKINDEKLEAYKKKINSALALGWKRLIHC